MCILEIAGAGLLLALGVSWLALLWRIRSKLSAIEKEAVRPRENATSTEPSIVNSGGHRRRSIFPRLEPAAKRGGLLSVKPPAKFKRLALQSGPALTDKIGNQFELNGGPILRCAPPVQAWRGHGRPPRHAPSRFNPRVKPGALPGFNGRTSRN